MNAVKHFIFLVGVLLTVCAKAQTVPVPDLPTVSSNTCGPKILTRGTPPPGITWYWVGTDPNGTSTLSDQTYSVNSSNGSVYYLRAKSGSDWSAAVGVTVFTDPVDITLTSYDVPNVQATHSITLAGGFLVPPGKSFTATIGITSECNDPINWNEQITYDAQENPISRSRVYADGLGEALQSQSIDFLTQKVWTSQPVRDKSNQPAISTLPAPILENDFIYKKSFVTSAITGQAYGPNDFDKSLGTSAGDVYNPNGVGNGPGTLGWYYSNQNTLEPATPTTSFPYSRSYQELGPDPTKSQAAGPGDPYKMGTGHEVSGERQTFVKSDLSHYYSLRPYFVTSSMPSNVAGANVLTNAAGESLTGIQSIGSTMSLVTLSGSTFIQTVSSSGASNTGVNLTSSPISVSEGEIWTFRVLGYRMSAIASNLVVKNASTSVAIPSTIVSLPGGEVNKNWAETTFVIPSGCTSISLNVLWTEEPSVGDAFFIDAVSLNQPTTSDALAYGYKTIVTDADGKKVVTFSDADGHTLASALIVTTSPLTYDRWSYTYYNDLGQVIASVAPNGVTSSTVLPQFTNYTKYDHLGRVIETSSPDEGMSQFVYNLDGQVRFSQNALQRDVTHKFSYTNYDYLGRLIESGEYAEETGSFKFEPHTTSTPATNSVLNIVETPGFTGVSRKVPTEQNRCTDYSFVEYDVQASDYAPGPAPAQTNLIGQISKTENEFAKTWYSYNEFGNVLWTKQSITGFGEKTIEYVYDYFGNVTEVAYQKASTTDRFHHHYTYDGNQRLSEVYTSKDGVTKTLQAKYYYYLHGPLKRIELATNVQGIDYVYNIDGSLKMINHSDPALDPGLDGLSGPHAGFMKDVFGEVLDYNANDYSSPGINDGTVTLSGYQDQFNGEVKDIRWHSPTDSHIQRAYAYSYDNVNQLDNSKFGNVSGSNGNYSIAFPDLAYNEDIGSYDKNGNIQSLVRKDRKAANIGNYAYNYQANTNKLNSVTDNTASFLNYTYNSIGQMTQQVEGDKTMKIAYNPYGLVKEIRNEADALIETFGYDDRGNRITRTVYKDGAPLNTTYYVYEASGNVLAIYQQRLPGTTISLAEVPVYGGGRVGVYKPAVNTYFYEISDHLGNVRGVIGNPETLVYTATIEDNGLAEITNPRVQEMANFKNLGTTDVTDANMNHTAPSQYMATPVYSSYPYWTTGVIGSEAKDKSVGPAIGLKVEPGDKLDFGAWVKYEKKGTYSRPGIAGDIVSILAGNFVGTAPGLDVIAKATQVFQYGVAGALAGNGNDAVGLPYAYMYYLLYDNNFNPVTAGWARVSTAGGFDVGQESVTPHGMISIPTITVGQPGYLYAFVVNESEQTRVWFDDFKVTHQRSTIVAGADYYPFGLAMKEREIGREDYRYGFQGQYSEKDPVTGWNNFELRMYDARIGRWISPDPYGQFASPYLAMNNSPQMNTDPSGGFCCGTTTIINGEVYQVLEEVVVTATSAVRESILPALQSGLQNTLTFGTGAVNAFSNNFTIGGRRLLDPNTQRDPYLFAKGQEFGHYASIGIGIFESYFGSSMVAGGGALTISGVGTVPGVFVAGTGLALRLHGSAVASYAFGNLSKVHPNATTPSLRDLELPGLDNKLKVHGDLPKKEDFGKYSRDALEQFLKDLKISVKTRIKVTSDLKPSSPIMQNRSHGQRQAQEQQLIIDLEKYLNGK